jgi:hypothetical protein
VAPLALAGCGSNTPTDPGSGGGGGPAAKLSIFDIYLRPRAIMRVPDAGGLPNPQLAQYYLTAFFEGGSGQVLFDWTAVAGLGVGEIIPKAADLGTDAPTVTLSNDGNSALGFYDFTVSAKSGSESSSMTRRFAVIENTWQKHQRAEFDDPQDPPATLTGFPIFAPSPGGDEIFYIEAPNDISINLRRINAFPSLNGPEQAPDALFLVPPGINGEQANVAAEITPALSPAGMGRNDLLFSSQMDPNDDQRPNTTKVPFRLCLVRRPAGFVLNQATVLTQDSTYVFAGRDNWYAFDFYQPRWDPQATGLPARVAFLSNLGPRNNTTVDVWTADLVDTNADGQADDLVNYNQLTDFGNVTGFDWHPDGQSLYLTGDPMGIRKVSAIDGSLEKSITFVDQDSLLSGPAYVSVFKRAGGHTLIAFQALSENLTHLYVYDEDDGVLSRVSPFPYSLGAQLFPSWHPEKMWLTYICDYSVNAWSTDLDPPPVLDENFERQARTAYPSVWVMKFED